MEPLRLSVNGPPPVPALGLSPADNMLSTASARPVSGLAAEPSAPIRSSALDNFRGSVSATPDDVERGMVRALETQVERPTEPPQCVMRHSAETFASSTRCATEQPELEVHADRDESR